MAWLMPTSAMASNDLRSAVASTGSRERQSVCIDFFPAFVL
jgi:hypothetical protein